MRLLIGMILGAALVYGATAYASSSHPAAIPAPQCKNTQPTYWVCSFPDPRSLTDIYALRVPGLDLTCDLHGLQKNFSDETLTCNSASRPTHACSRFKVPGMPRPVVTYGSLSVYITRGAYVVVKAPHCIPVDDPYGYDVPSYGRSYIFDRSP